MGPHRGPGGMEGHCLEHEGPSLEGPCGRRCPRAPGPSPQGGLRVTRWDAEEDTKAGWGPGWAALVSCPGSWPPRQVQKTGRQGAAEWVRAVLETAPWAQGQGAASGPAARAGRSWGQGRPASSLSSSAGLIPLPGGPHTAQPPGPGPSGPIVRPPTQRCAAPRPPSEAGFTRAHRYKRGQPYVPRGAPRAQVSLEARPSDPRPDASQAVPEGFSPTLGLLSPPPAPKGVCHCSHHTAVLLAQTRGPFLGAHTARPLTQQECGRMAARCHRVPRLGSECHGGPGYTLPTASQPRPPSCKYQARGYRLRPWGS